MVELYGQPPTIRIRLGVSVSLSIEEEFQLLRFALRQVTSGGWGLSLLEKLPDVRLYGCVYSYNLTEGQQPPSGMGWTLGISPPKRSQFTARCL